LEVLVEAGAGKKQADGERRTFLTAHPLVDRVYGYHGLIRCLILPGWE